MTIAWRSVNICISSFFGQNIQLLFFSVLILSNLRDISQTPFFVYLSIGEINTEKEEDSNVFLPQREQTQIMTECETRVIQI